MSAGLGFRFALAAFLAAGALAAFLAAGALTAFLAAGALAAFLAAGFALVAFLAIVLLAAVAVGAGYESALRSVNANFINI
ncbi:MAG: hypothetical protein ACYC67_03445 [Prosthecobacter sp.]